MIELLRKDFRLYRPVFIAWAILMAGTCLVPFVIAMLVLSSVFGWYALIAQGLTICLMIIFLKKHVGIYRAAFIAVLSVLLVYLMPLIIAMVSLSILGRPDDPIIFTDCAMFGQASAVLLAPAFGGCAFAIERRDRSAEFLAMMPVSRWDVVASKTIISTAALLPLWIIHSTFVYLTGNEVLRPSLARDLLSPHVTIDIMSFWAYILPAALILLVFGVSWLFSTLIKSPAISACLGLAAFLFLVIVREQMFLFSFARPDIDVLIAACAVTIGSLCFLAGTIIFTQRVSP